MKDFFNEDVYKSVYRTGSRPGRMYSLPKLHKIFHSVPAFKPKNIVSRDLKLPIS